MFCESCGAEIKTNTKVCDVCGIKLPKQLQKELKNKTVELVLVIDESGSMAGKEGSVRESVNKFINDQKEGEGTANLSIFGFSSYNDYRVIVPRTELKKVGVFSDYNVRNSTALLDAVGKTITSVKEYCIKEKIHKVIMGIITDGQENDSREFGRENIKTLIEQQTKEGWIIEYMMNDVSEAQAKNIGMSMGLSSLFSYGGANVKATYQAFSDRTQGYRKDSF